MYYKSCEALEQGIAFMHENVRVCCNDSHEGRGFENEPFFYFKNSDEIVWEDYFEYKNLIRTKNQDQEPYPACKGCLYLENKDWNNIDNTKLSYLNFNHWRDCDTKCIYCDVKIAPNKKNKIQPIYKHLKELDKKNLIAKNGMVMFGGGDIAFLPEFESIVKIFMKHNYYFNIATSATHNVPIINKLLNKGCIELRVSVDSAKEETYKKIKGTNFYNKVWKNIKTYAKSQSCKYSLRLKYIIIPGLNDNEEEILAWLNKSKEFGIKSVIIDIEAGYLKKNGKNIPEKILKLFEYTKNEAQKMNLYFMIFDHASQMLSQFDNYLKDYYFTKDITQKMLREHKKNNNSFLCFLRK